MEITNTENPKIKFGRGDVFDVKDWGFDGLAVVINQPISHNLRFSLERYLKEGVIVPTDVYGLDNSNEPMMSEQMKHKLKDVGWNDVNEPILTREQVKPKIKEMLTRLKNHGCKNIGVFGSQISDDTFLVGAKQTYKAVREWVEDHQDDIDRITLVSFDGDYNQFAKNITIRRATADDAEFIAWAVCDSRDNDPRIPYNPGLVESCKQEDMLYSWKNALIATIDGTPVGCQIAYDGALYPKQRNVTWRKAWNIWKNVHDDSILWPEYEATEGEFYLDTLAVKEGYKGLNIGKKLTEYSIEVYRNSGGTNSITLIMDSRKTDLLEYYKRMGFSFLRKQSYGNVPDIKLIYNKQPLS